MGITKKSIPSNILTKTDTGLLRACGNGDHCGSDCDDNAAAGKVARLIVTTVGCTPTSTDPECVCESLGRYSMEKEACLNFAFDPILTL